MEGWTWKALCNEAPFRFGKNLASSGIRTRDPVIRSRERLPLGHVDASKDRNPRVQVLQAHEADTQLKFKWQARSSI